MSSSLPDAEVVILDDAAEVLEIARPLEHPRRPLGPAPAGLDRDPHRLMLLQRQGLARPEDAVLIDGFDRDGHRGPSGFHRPRHGLHYNQNRRSITEPSRPVA